MVENVIETLIEKLFLQFAMSTIISFNMEHGKHVRHQTLRSAIYNYTDLQLTVIEIRCHKYPKLPLYFKCIIQIIFEPF